MILGNEVVVVWGDGHESYFPGVALRKACTCATCAGEQHLFGRATLPTLTALPPEAFQPIAVHVLGNYGVQVTWADGHDHGIYHVDRLRASCPCQECAAGRRDG